jgi:hypothetical protein
MSAALDWLNQHERSLPTLEVVRDIVKRAETTLSVLHIQRAQLVRRIHALRYLAQIAAQQELRKADLSVSTPTLSIRPKKQLRSGQMKSQRRVLEGRRKSASNLRRACRIALMESDRPQNSLEILERITKRGSFTFERHIDPPKTISQELNKMAEEGEIIGLVVGETRCWECNTRLTSRLSRFKA